MKKQRDNDINLQSLAETVNNSGQPNKVIDLNAAAVAKKAGWRKDFVFNKTKNGEEPTIKSTAINNATLILNYDPNLQGLFKLNEFTQNIEVVKDKTIDLEGVGPIKFSKGLVQDIDAIYFGLYCETHYNVTFKQNLLFNAIEASARQHSYNPIVDYMDNAKKKWDGKQRLDELFPTFLGAEDNETTKLITELWFMGGVAKAYNPLTKIDTCLDIVGDQGTGKTTLLKNVAPEGMYTDQFTSFSDKDDLANMNEAFIVNDDEMDASNQCTFAEVKKFMSMQTIKYRSPYARKASQYPKHFIVARTTNDKAHLRDSTGDRRFMTILVNAKNQKKKPFYLKPEYTLQLWGEAVNLYKSFKDSGKNPFELNDHQEALLKANREQFRQTTALQDAVEDAVNDHFAYTQDPDKNQNYIVPSDLAQYIYDDQNYFVKNKKVSAEINRIMESLGYTKSPHRVNGKLKRYFFYIGE